MSGRRERGLGMRWKIGGLVGASLFCGIMLSCIVTLAIWPGEAKLFAPLICDDSHADAVVVYDQQSVRPGETATTFSLYCMGPRGNVIEHGWGTVMLYSMVVHTVLVAAFFGFLWFLVARRGRSRRTRAQADDDAGEPSAAPPLITKA
ncbi:MAG TPA: hypothetical protein VMM60_09160 [Ilumatobacter sp.]|nr:hypothetical protein [Ilumatobacter sp.]